MRGLQKKKQMRGSFAALRMTAIRIDNESGLVIGWDGAGLEFD